MKKRIYFEGDVKDCGDLGTVSVGYITGSPRGGSAIARRVPLLRSWISYRRRRLLSDR